MVKIKVSGRKLALRVTPDSWKRASARLQKRGVNPRKRLEAGDIDILADLIHCAALAEQPDITLVEIRNLLVDLKPPQLKRVFRALQEAELKTLRRAEWFLSLQENMRRSCDSILEQIKCPTKAAKAR